MRHDRKMLNVRPAPDAVELKPRRKCVQRLFLLLHRPSHDRVYEGWLKMSLRSLFGLLALGMFALSMVGVAFIFARGFPGWAISLAVWCGLLTLVFAWLCDNTSPSLKTKPTVIELTQDETADEKWRPGFMDYQAQQEYQTFKKVCGHPPPPGVKREWDEIRRYDETKQSCFIATAAFGDPMSRELKILRRLREEVLLKNKVGSGLVSTYYKLSPPIAKFIRDKCMLRRFTRTILKPVLRVSKLIVGSAEGCLFDEEGLDSGTRTPNLACR